MYEVTCTLSREMLLAPCLVEQTMPGSRIKEMKVPGAQMAGHSAGGGGGTAGRSSMDQLESGKCGVRAFCLCYHWNGAERPDRKLFSSGSRCIELSGAEPWRDTTAPGTHLPVSPIAPPEPPPLPPWAALKLRDTFLCMVRSPVMASGEAASCRDPCRAGTVRGAAEGSEAAAAVSYCLPGWDRGHGNIIPHSAVLSKALPGFEDLPPVVKPPASVRPGLVATKSSMCQNIDKIFTSASVPQTMLNFTANPFS